MKTRSGILAGLTLLGSTAALAQDNQAPAFGEVLVTAQRQNAPFYRQDRPVVGLRRAADGAVMQFMINSDTRDAATRKEEIHTVLLTALDRAAAAGVELVSGSFQLASVTSAYAENATRITKQIAMEQGQCGFVGAAKAGAAAPAAQPKGGVN